MDGSPNSSMMLRSHCRSTPDIIVPKDHNNFNNFFWSIGAAAIVSSLTFYLLYSQYILPRIEQETTNLNNKVNKLKENYRHCLSHSEQLFKEGLNLYDADKLNLADYALESSGGTIVTTRCTRSYLEKNIKYSIDGFIPVFFTSNSPRVVIQPSIVPGECWSFAGAEGVMVVQLSRTIIPTSFTYEHIRKELSPDLNIDSAPRHFRIKSLKDENDKEGLLLGEYDYDKDGPPLQRFKVQNPNPMPTRFIELIIQSNHGEMRFTCLYRFRVHGNKYL